MILIAHSLKYTHYSYLRNLFYWLVLEVKEMHIGRYICSFYYLPLKGNELPKSFCFSIMIPLVSLLG